MRDCAGVLLELRDGGVRFSVHVSPRASRTQVMGVHDGALKLSLKAPPVDGAANEELVRYLAKALGVSRSDVVLVAGQASRRKTIDVAGVAPKAVCTALTALL